MDQRRFERRHPFYPAGSIEFQPLTDQALHEHLSPAIQYLLGYLHGSDEKENELKNFTYFPQDADRRAKSSIQTDPGN